MNSLDSVGKICAGWWGGALASDHGAARRARAELRRADGPVAVLAVGEVHDLHARLRAQGHNPAPERLALIAAALAHVAEGQGPRPAEAFGAGDPPALNAIRFNALIRAREIRDLWRPLIRALDQVKGLVSPAALAEDIFYWGDKARTRWCFDYYGESFAAPDRSMPEEEPAA